MTPGTKVGEVSPAAFQEENVPQQIDSTPEPTPEVTEEQQVRGSRRNGLDSRKKYQNKPNCGNMNPDKAREISRSNAESQGYGPCKNCY